MIGTGRQTFIRTTACSVVNNPRIVQLALRPDFWVADIEIHRMAGAKRFSHFLASTVPDHCPLFVLRRAMPDTVASKVIRQRDNFRRHADQPRVFRPIRPSNF
jgi:hypothetical protein